MLSKFRLGVIAKNRKVKLVSTQGNMEEKRIDDIAQSLSKDEFEEIKIGKNKEKTVWVAMLKVEISKLSGVKTIAIVMNAPSFETATDIDYLITNKIRRKSNNRMDNIYL